MLSHIYLPVMLNVSSNSPEDKDNHTFSSAHDISPHDSLSSENTTFPYSIDISCKFTRQTKLPSYLQDYICNSFKTLLHHTGVILFPQLTYQLLILHTSPSLQSL